MPAEQTKKIKNESFVAGISETPRLVGDPERKNIFFEIGVLGACK